MESKKRSKHIYSTIALISIIAITIIAIVFPLTTKDIDEVCSTNNTFLYKYAGTWICFNQQYDDTQTPLINVKIGANAITFDETEGTYKLTHAGAAINEQYFFTENQISHSYKEGTDITCHLHAYETTYDNQNITIEFKYKWYNIGEQYLHGQQ